MKVFNRKLKLWKLLAIIIVITICIAWYFIAGNKMRFSNLEISNYFNERNIDYVINTIANDTGELRFISSGLYSDEIDRAIIFIHGAPGSSDSFYSYLTDSSLIKKARLVALDRPGYGYSSYGHPRVSILDQAQAVLAIMQDIQAKRVVLVSHSYGCAIAGVLAAERPDLIIANIMLCPVIDPGTEKVFFFSSWPSLPIVKHLFSGANQVSSFEKMSHVEELESIQDLWYKTAVPTVIFHGEKDWIAPVENAYFLDDKVDAKYLDVDIDKDASHFIVWTQHEKVVQKILEFL